MMNDPVYERLREQSWRGKLTEAQEAELRAWLASHPEAQADWETEVGLNEALGALGEAPLGNNFTARVLQAVELDVAAEARRRRRSRVAWLKRLVPRMALAALLGVAGYFSAREAYQMRLRREVRQSVMDVSAVSSLPSPDILENFDAIRLSTEPAADEKLLSLLQ